MDSEIPILTTLFVRDDRELWRYPELLEWVKHCIVTTEQKRLILVESIPAELRQWLLDNGHEIFVEAKDCGKSPPRMAAMLGRAVKLLSSRPQPSRFVWTIELDSCLLPETKSAAEQRFARSPNNVAGVELRSVDEAGETIFPCHRRFASPPEKNKPFSIRHICWSCTLWRFAALRKVDWGKLPSLNHSDTIACDQLRRQGWQMRGLHSLTYVHKPHGSYRFQARYHPAPEPEILKPVALADAPPTVPIPPMPPIHAQDAPVIYDADWPEFTRFPDDALYVDRPSGNVYVKESELQARLQPYKEYCFRILGYPVGGI